jgi:hypothetical protein
MKWMLFVLVFGAHPVQTNLIYDNLGDCLKAELTMRNEYARAYSEGAGTEANQGERSEPYLSDRYGLKTTATCIPHA